MTRRAYHDCSNHGYDYHYGGRYYVYYQAGELKGMLRFGTAKLWSWTRPRRLARGARRWKAMSDDDDAAMDVAHDEQAPALPRPYARERDANGQLQQEDQMPGSVDNMFEEQSLQHSSARAGGEPCMHDVADTACVPGAACRPCASPRAHAWKEGASTWKEDTMVCAQQSTFCCRLARYRRLRHARRHEHDLPRLSQSRYVA